MVGNIRDGQTGGGYRVHSMRLAPQTIVPSFVRIAPLAEAVLRPSACVPNFILAPTVITVQLASSKSPPRRQLPAKLTVCSCHTTHSIH